MSFTGGIIKVGSGKYRFADGYHAANDTERQIMSAVHNERTLTPEMIEYLEKRATNGQPEQRKPGRPRLDRADAVTRKDVLGD